MAIRWSSMAVKLLTAISSIKIRDAEIASDTVIAISSATRINAGRLLIRREDDIGDMLFFDAAASDAELDKTVAAAGSVDFAAMSRKIAGK